jgi:hypothetical protein
MRLPSETTPIKILSWPILKTLVDSSEKNFQDLTELYAHLPGTRCLRQGHCCSLLPEMTLMEALSAFRSLMLFAPDQRKAVFKRMVGTFFSNAFEITSCPFLEGGRCLIYSERFFGCRAYGLWSLRYYEEQAAMNRRVKKELQTNWRRLGVILPAAIVDFHQPYCTHVVPRENDGVMEDARLEELGHEVEKLSRRYRNWNPLFVQTYYSDLSFLSASLVFGITQATRLKFTLVRDYLITGNRNPLNLLLEGLPDIGALR